MAEGFQPDPAVLHLPAIAFQSDGAGGGDFQILDEQFAVTFRSGAAVADGDYEFVPVLGLVLLEIFVRASERIIPTLKLGLPDKHPAVRVGSRTEFKFQDEIFREFVGGGELLDAAPFRRCGNHKAAGHSAEPVVVAFGFSVKRNCLGYLDEDWGIGPRVSGCFAGRGWAESTASEVFSIEQAHKALLLLGICFFGRVPGNGWRAHWGRRREGV